MYFYLFMFFFFCLQALLTFPSSVCTNLQVCKSPAQPSYVYNDNGS